MNHSTTQRPTTPDTWLAKARHLEETGKRGAAKQALEQALSLKPDHRNALQMRLEIASTEQDHTSIHRLCDRVLSSQPGRFDLRKIKTAAYKVCGDFNAARAQCEAILRLFPRDADTRAEIGHLYLFEGRHRDAMAAYETVLRQHPNQAFARYFLGLMQFLTTEFKEGYENYEARFSIGDIGARSADCPRWQGEPLAGKHLLIWAEQGVGDIIMFAGLIPWVLEQAETVTLALYEHHIPLFARSFPETTCLPIRVDTMHLTPDTPADFHTPISDLMRYGLPHFRPAEHGAYLKADPDRVAHWRQMFDALGPGRKVGIAWHTVNHITGFLRNIPLAQWLPILKTPGCQFISLQYDNARFEARQLAQAHGVYVHVEAEMEPVLQTDDFAAQISALDQVTTIQNSTAHFGGALGVPTTLLLPHCSDWRWGLENTQNPWYSAVSVVRQAMPMQWKKELARVAADLKIEIR